MPEGALCLRYERAKEVLHAPNNMHREIIITEREDNDSGVMIKND